MGDGSWAPTPKNWMPNEWLYAHDDPIFRLLLEPLPSGQVGLFPEQRQNWHWIAHHTACAGQSLSKGGSANLSRPLKILNLFA
jgi:hypothetical protein